MATFTALNGITADGWRARKQGSLVYQFAYDPQGSVQTRQTDTAFSSGFSAYDRSTFEGYGAFRAANKGSTGARVAQHDPAGIGSQFGYYDPGMGKFCGLQNYRVICYNSVSISENTLLKERAHARSFFLFRVGRLSKKLDETRGSTELYYERRFY